MTLLNLSLEKKATDYIGSPCVMHIVLFLAKRGRRPRVAGFIILSLKWLRRDEISFGVYGHVYLFIYLSVRLVCAGSDVTWPRSGATSFPGPLSFSSLVVEERETLVAAGHVSMYTNQSRTRGGSSTKFFNRTIQFCLGEGKQYLFSSLVLRARFSLVSCVYFSCS